MLVVVIPAFNEAQTIGQVIDSLVAEGFKNIVVVDDGSKDETGLIAKKHGAIVLRHILNRGQGASLQTGNAYALRIGASIIVHFDADGQFNPKDIAPAARLIKEGKVEVILGSRFLDTRSKIPWTKEYLIFPVTRVLNRWFTGLSLTDGQNGFRVMSAESVKKITITHDGMAHNSEIIRQIGRQHIRFQEFPVQVTYHRYGLGVRGGIAIVGKLLLRFLSAE